MSKKKKKLLLISAAVIIAVLSGGLGFFAGKIKLAGAEPTSYTERKFEKNELMTEERKIVLTSRETFAPFDNPSTYTYIGLDAIDTVDMVDEYNSSLIDTLYSGEQVIGYGYDGDYILIEKNELLSYAPKDLLKEGRYYAQYENAVDLRQIMPRAKFDILFATDNNVVGSPMYPAIPLMEESCAAKMKEAYDRFNHDGYTVVVCDAYRPKSASIQVWNVSENAKFLTDPYSMNSWHNYGKAIDLTLISNETGKELEMPTPMHAFDEMACRYSNGNWSEEVKANVKYLTEVMEDSGFSRIETEWWHYQYEGAGLFLPTQIDYSEIKYVKAD